MNIDEKQNQKTADGHHTITPLRELNLADDFLFDVTTCDLEACQIIIELSLYIYQSLS